MGWWKIEGTEQMIGDEPLDALGGAVSRVVEAYQAAWKRKPTIAEWEILLGAVLGAEEAEHRVSDERVPEAVSIRARR